MALLPEDLSDYSLSGLFAMADLMTEIVDNRAPDHQLPVKFLESLDELREEINQEINAQSIAEERDLMGWLPQAIPEVKPCPLPR
jgi:hypothetical protein